MHYSFFVDMYTTQQYNALCEAISLGATRVSYGDKTVDYRNLSEMKQIKSDMERELGIKTGSKIKLVGFERGY